MNQFSNNGKPVQLEVVSGQLLFIDPAYFEEIATTIEEMNDIPRSDMKTFIQEIEQRVFPYGGGSLLGFKQLENGSKTYELNPIAVVRYNSDETEGEVIEQQAVQKSITAFGIDTASFLIIDLANFDALLPLLHSDDLFDLNDNPANGYIDNINSSLGNCGWAYVSSPGIGKGFDFDGDGSYFLKNQLPAEIHEEMTGINPDDPQENAYFSRYAMESALNSDDPEMLEQVILAGGDVNVELRYGWTPMHYVMDLAIDGMIQNNRESPYPEAIEMIRILISHGADLDKRNWEGQTPLDSINTYAGNEQGFNSLMAMFKGVIPSLDERVQYPKEQITLFRLFHTVSYRIILYHNVSKSRADNRKIP